jgi:hypothetical protein
MATRYRVVFDEPAQETFLSVPVSNQRSLLECLRKLGAHPSHRGFQQVIDAAGRVNEVGEFDGFVVTYWADHAVSGLGVVAIERI